MIMQVFSSLSTHGGFNIASAFPQGFDADVMLAEMVHPCPLLLAHKLNVSWVNHWPLPPFEPEFTSLWPWSNRRMFQPNPLSYFPQLRVRASTQYMVSSKRCTKTASTMSSHNTFCV